MVSWASLLSKLSCLCGIGEAVNGGNGGGAYDVQLKVKNRCCNGKTVYNKSVTLTLPEGMTSEEFMRVLDKCLEEISQHSY